MKNTELTPADYGYLAAKNDNNNAKKANDKKAIKTEEGYIYRGFEIDKNEKGPVWKKYHTGFNGRNFTTLKNAKAAIDEHFENVEKSVKEKRALRERVIRATPAEEAKPEKMKTIAVFYKTPEKSEDFGKHIAEIVCKETTIEEHYEIRASYIENPEYCKSLSFCWHMHSKEADEIAEKYNQKK